ncbi:MAG: SDR family NAD(P)-dependent oxidoreductase [Gammaproteobacteria bacterium]|nr:SDR family NAD(P)-dependent oxidoreductase [Gammaproteobacteria bacterium]
MNIANKVAFITGGGSGIGRGMARAFLDAGLKVAIADIRTDRLERVKESLEADERDFFAVEADVSQMDSLERAADTAESHFGKIHIVCNNAGIGVGGPVHSTPMDRWRRVVDINLWGVVNGCQVFTPRIQSHGEGGHIVNTASIMGLFTSQGSGPYCATKFAVVAISECLRKELKECNIGVSVLCPFIVDTPIFYPDLDDLDIEAIDKRKKQLGFLQHAVTPVFAGETVLRAIENNELYIFTDGNQSRQMIQSRVDRLFEGMDRQWPREN